MFSNEEFLGLGGTRPDQFALGLNDKMSKGWTQRTRDFNNPPLSSGGTEFDVARVEVCMLVDANESPYDDFGRPKNPKNKRPQGRGGPAAEDQFLLDAAGITGCSKNFRAEKAQFEVVPESEKEGQD